MSPCPVCNRPAAARPENRSHPFCSARCRTIDLGKWLDEGYRVPDVDASEGELSTEDPSAQENA